MSEQELVKWADQFQAQEEQERKEVKTGQATQRRLGFKQSMNTNIPTKNQSQQDQWIPEPTQEQHWTDSNPEPRHSPN